MASINTILFYLDVVNKKLVNVGGSPTTVPDMFYGDFPTITVLPVIPSSANPAQGYTAFSAAGFTMDVTMAGEPNATSPPTPFAQLPAMVWQGSGGTPPNCFTGDLDLTQAATGNYIGTLPQNQAWINFDLVATVAPFKRTTLLQTTFNIVASIDAVTPSPGGATVTNLTLAYLLNIFLLKNGAPGDGPILQSADTTKKRQLVLGNDGNTDLIPV